MKIQMEVSDFRLPWQNAFWPKIISHMPKKLIFLGNSTLGQEARMGQELPFFNNRLTISVGSADRIIEC